MSSAAMDEAAALFADGKGPSLHPEDALSRSRSVTPESDNLGDEQSHPPHASVGNGSSYDAYTTNPAFYAPDDANTGPKGVIADARAYERAWLARRRNKSPPNGHGGNNNMGMWPFRRDENNNNHNGGRHATPPEATTSADGADSNEEDDLLEDGEFLQRWRHERLAELKAQGQQRDGRRQSPSMRRYGRVTTVDAVGYLDAIEKVGRETVVVVCIYDDEVFFFLSLSLYHLLIMFRTPFWFTADIFFFLKKSPTKATKSKPSSPNWQRDIRRRASSNCTTSRPKWTWPAYRASWPTSRANSSPIWSRSCRRCPRIVL